MYDDQIQFQCLFALQATLRDLVLLSHTTLLFPSFFKILSPCSWGTQCRPLLHHFSRLIVSAAQVFAMPTPIFPPHNHVFLALYDCTGGGWCEERFEWIETPTPSRPQPLLDASNSARPHSSSHLYYLLTPSVLYGYPLCVA